MLPARPDQLPRAFLLVLRCRCPNAPTAAPWQRMDPRRWPAAIRPAAVRRARRTSVKLGPDAKVPEAAGWATAALSPSEIASMMPVDVLLFAMRHEVECGQLRTAASIAEKAAPYLHAKMAPRAGGWGCRPRTPDQDHRRPAGRVSDGRGRSGADELHQSRPGAPPRVRGTATSHSVNLIYFWSKVA